MPASQEEFLSNILFILTKEKQKASYSHSICLSFLSKLYFRGRFVIVFKLVPQSCWAPAMPSVLWCRMSRFTPTWIFLMLHRACVFKCVFVLYRDMVHGRPDAGSGEKRQIGPVFVWVCVLEGEQLEAGLGRTCWCLEEGRKGVCLQDHHGKWSLAHSTGSKWYEAYFFMLLVQVCALIFLSFHFQGGFYLCRDSVSVFVSRTVDSLTPKLTSNSLTHYHLLYTHILSDSTHHFSEILFNFWLKTIILVTLSNQDVASNPSFLRILWSAFISLLLSWGGCTRRKAHFRFLHWLVLHPPSTVLKNKKFHSKNSYLFFVSPLKQSVYAVNQSKGNQIAAAQIAQQIAEQKHTTFTNLKAHVGIS